MTAAADRCFKDPFRLFVFAWQVECAIHVLGFRGRAYSLAMGFSRYEQRVLDDPLSYVALVAILVAAAAELWFFNRRRAKSAVLYYEELDQEAITTLGIGTWQATGREVLADRR